MNRLKIFIVLMLFSQLTMAFSYIVEISQAELQNKVSAMMPLEKKTGFIDIILSNPKIELLEGSNEIGIFSHIDATVPKAKNAKGSGSVKVIGTIEYRPETGAFFFKNPKIEKLQIQKLPDKYAVTIRTFAQPVIKKVLAKYPVYTLKDDNLKQKLAKALLQSVSVKDKNLLLELKI